MDKSKISTREIIVVGSCMRYRDKPKRVIVISLLIAIGLFCMLSMGLFASATTTKPLHDPTASYAPPPTPYSQKFRDCRALDFIITSEGEFKSEFVCHVDTPIKINSIKVINSLTNTECMVTTQLPLTTPFTTIAFTIEGMGCIPLDSRREHEWMTLNVEILYDTLSRNGTTLEENLSESGEIVFTPAIAREKQEDSNVLPVTLVCFAIVLVGLFIIHRSKPKRIVSILVSMLLSIVIMFLLIAVGFISRFLIFGASHTILAKIMGVFLPAVIVVGSYRRYRDTPKRVIVIFLLIAIGFLFCMLSMGQLASATTTKPLHDPTASYAPPPESFIRGFSVIAPTEATIIENNTIEIIFINNYTKPLKAKSIKIFNHLNEEKCIMTTPLPINLSVQERRSQ